MLRIEKKVTSFKEAVKKDKQFFDNHKEIKEFIIFLLKFVKIFTSDKVDKIIDEIILILNA